MLRETNADGVVIGRGCLGRPWLFQQLSEIFNGFEPSDIPTLGEVSEVMRQHAERVVDWNGTQDALRTFRKHATWYLTGFPVGSEARRAIHQITSLVELRQVLDSFDPSAPLPLEAYRLPRSHKGGPKKATLPMGWLDDPFADSKLSPDAEQLVSGG